MLYECLQNACVHTGHLCSRVVFALRSLFEHWRRRVVVQCGSAHLTPQLIPAATTTKKTRANQCIQPTSQQPIHLSGRTEAHCDVQRFAVMCSLLLSLWVR